MKRTYLVIACSKCERLVLARQGTRTRQCPYCGTRMNLSKIEPLWVTTDVDEARSILHSKRESKSDKSKANEHRKRTSTRF